MISAVMRTPGQTEQTTIAKYARMDRDAGARLETTHLERHHRMPTVNNNTDADPGDKA